MYPAGFMFAIVTCWPAAKLLAAVIVTVFVASVAAVMTATVGGIFTTSTWLGAPPTTVVVLTPGEVIWNAGMFIPESGPDVPATKPTNAVITTKTVIRGFVSET